MGHYAKHDLPTDPASLVEILDAHVERQRWEFNPRHAWYSVYNAYGNGVRRFRALDLEGGRVDWSFVDENGKIAYRHTKLPALVDRITTRATALDWTPKVKREGVSLQSVRQQASAQTFLRHLVRPANFDAPFTEYAWMVAAYGFGGFCATVVPHPTLGMTVEFVPIHPAELYSFPTVIMDPSKQRGLMWRRFAPLAHLEERFGKKAISAKRAKLDTWETTFGENLELNDNVEPRGVGGGSPSRARTDRTGGLYTRASGSNSQTVAELRDLWLFGPLGDVTRYIVQCGDAILLDKEFEPGSYYCPIHTARFLQSGSFKGLGVYDLLWSVNRQTETMFEQLFENVRKLEQYPVMMLPHGAFDANVDFKATKFGMKYGYYTPDPFGGKSQPIPISPVNSGAFPVQVAQAGMAVSQDILPEGSILGGDAPGRVDREGALRFLEAQTFNPIMSYLASLRLSLVGCYRSILSQASDLVATGEAFLPVTVVDSSMAGLVLTEGEAGQQRFDPSRNPLPDPCAIDLTVVDEEPRTGESRKMEAIQMQQMGLQSPRDTLLLLLKEGLDPAVFCPDVQGAIRRTDANIAILYGDGETPGQVVLTPQTEVPWVAIRLVKAFMADPAFSAASTEVQDSFWDYLQYLMAQLQPVLPTGMPNPDDLALATIGEQTLAAQGGGQNPTPNPAPPSG